MGRSRRHRRLQRHRFATGLDAAAVYGGKLSALVLTAAPNASLATPPGQVLHAGRLLQVSAQKGSCAVPPSPPTPPQQPQQLQPTGRRRGKGKGKGRRRRGEAAADA